MIFYDLRDAILFELLFMKYWISNQGRFDSNLIANVLLNI